MAYKCYTVYFLVADMYSVSSEEFTMQESSGRCMRTFYLWYWRNSSIEKSYTIGEKYSIDSQQCKARIPNRSTVSS